MAATKKKATQKKATVSRGKKKATGINSRQPKKNKETGSKKVKGAIKENLEKSQNFVVAALIKTKDGIANGFVALGDLLKSAGTGIANFFKGLADREQWKNKSGFMKNVFNLVLAGAVLVIGGQFLLALVGWTGLAASAAIGTVTCFAINRAAMTEDEVKTAGPITVKSVVMPAVA